MREPAGPIRSRHKDAPTIQRGGLFAHTSRPADGNACSREVFLEGKWIDPAVWEELEVFPKCFWKERNGFRPVYTLGSIAEGSLPSLQPHLAGTGLRAFGGRAFAAGNPNSRRLWRGWKNESFFLPALELIPQKNGTLLRLNSLPGDPVVALADSGIVSPEDLDRLTGLHGMRDQAPSLPAALARCDRPDFRGWSARVHSVLGELERDALRKVVLARVSTLDLVESAPVADLLFHVEAANPQCFIFGFMPSREAGLFMGASPERLYRREGREVFTEAVAGTRSRSLDPTEDTRLEQQLLDSPKERHEHAVVMESVAAAMRTICGGDYHAGEPEILKLSRLQHLCASFAGRLRNGCDDNQLLDLLHPTPATCGFPVAPAREFLLGQEPFDRGWFAGPFGMVSEKQTEFCVAIRSFHVRGSEVDIYAGAGIVENSDPVREWEELESKIAGPLSLFSAA